MNRVVDLNADVGEGGPDEVLMRDLTSCSIACGGHAGDGDSMRAALRAGRRHQLRIGAHPGYPDPEGFGRRDWPMSRADLFLSITSQLEAIGLVAMSLDLELTHVKTHGRLYNNAWTDAEIATVVARAVLAWSPRVALFCPAGSAQEQAATRLGLPVILEAFADRRYTADGTLAPRSEQGAVITDPAVLAAQLRAIAGLEFDSMCVHSDNPAAVELVAAVPGVAAELGWEVAPYPVL